MLLGSIYGWNFLLFTTQGNLSGALAMNIGEIALAGLTMLMFWLINHQAGYLLFPTFIWALFSLYLSISLVVLN
jgi:tryptophan-rich sensory protein